MSVERDMLPKELGAVMGLDLSLRSAGICVVSEQQSFYTETAGYDLRKATERQKVARISEIAQIVVDMAKAHQVRAIGVEGYAFRALGFMPQLGEVTGAVKVKCYDELGIVTLPIPCKSARKYLLGKAPNDSVRAKKAVQKYFEENFSLHVKKLDESDAAAIAVIMWDWVNGERSRLPSAKLEVLHRLDAAQGGQ